MPESIHIAPDRSAEPHGRPFKPAAVAPSALPTLGFSVSELLTLQRTIGNHGVGRHVGRRPPQDPGSGNIRRCSACAKPSNPLPENELPVQRDFLDDATAAVSDAGSSLVDAAGQALQGVVDTGSGLAQGAVATAGNLLDGNGGGGGGPSGGGDGGGSGGSGGGPTLPTLRPGAAGAAVSALQEKLGALGFSSPVSGVFDAATAAAVEAFQTAAGLVADGVVGLLTWAGLNKADDGGGAGPSATANVAP